MKVKSCQVGYSISPPVTLMLFKNMLSMSSL